MTAAHHPGNDKTRPPRNTQGEHDSCRYQTNRVLLVVAAALAFNVLAAAKHERALAELAARGEPATYAEAHALLLANAPDDDDNLAKVPALLAFQRDAEGRAALERLAVEQPAQHELLHRPGLDPGSAERTMRNLGQSAASSPDPDAEPVPSIHQLTVELHPAIHDLAAATRHRSRAYWSPTEVMEPRRLSSTDMTFHGLDQDLRYRAPAAGRKMAA